MNAAIRIEQTELHRDRLGVYRINHSGTRLADHAREVFPSVREFIENDVQNRGYCLLRIETFGTSKISARVD